LIVVILLAAGYIYYRQAMGSTDKIAQIYVNETLVGEYNLNKEQNISIDPHCSAEIKQHQIRMTRSDCRDKLCVKQNWSRQKPIICLPNRVVIEIVNHKDKRQIHILY
jgi:hypothetical protein